METISSEVGKSRNSADHPRKGTSRSSEDPGRGEGTVFLAIHVHGGETNLSELSGVPNKQSDEPELHATNGRAEKDSSVSLAIPDYGLRRSTPSVRKESKHVFAGGNRPVQQVRYRPTVSPSYG